MRHLFTICILGLLTSTTFAKKITENSCLPQTASDEVIYNSDFRWHYDLPTMMQKFGLMYNSPKRLDRRAYYEPGNQKYYLPYEDGRGGQIELTTEFIDTVTQHIEKAFERKFIDAVFFPDMGHSHILIPEAKFNKEYSIIPINNMNITYQKMFADPEIKIAYHTAEQLQSLDENNQPLSDKKIQWRYYTRNLVGDNGGEKKIEIYHALDASNANTLGSVPGYFWWGAGFNLSANKNGCFTYRKNGKTYNYDISMYDLPSDPNAPIEVDP